MEMFLLVIVELYAEFFVSGISLAVTCMRWLIPISSYITALPSVTSAVGTSPGMLEVSVLLDIL